MCIGVRTRTCFNDPQTRTYRIYSQGLPAPVQADALSRLDVNIKHDERKRYPLVYRPLTARSDGRSVIQLQA